MGWTCRYICILITIINRRSIKLLRFFFVNIFINHHNPIAGVVGLLVGFTTYLQIQYTSSLSHNISGVMKNCIQVYIFLKKQLIHDQSFIGAKIYHTPITTKGILGIILVVYGSLSYALERIAKIRRIKSNLIPEVEVNTYSVAESDIRENGMS